MQTSSLRMSAVITERKADPSYYRLLIGG